MVNMLSQATIIQMDTSNTEVATKELEKQLGGDLSWAEGLLE